MKALEGICNEKLPDPSPGEPILGEKCKKAEKDASGKCKGFFIKGSREPFFACSICEEKAEDPEEVESGQEGSSNICGHSDCGGHNMQNNGGRGAGGRDSAGNGGRRAPA
ncbi:hypothetical protein [Parablautia intestinalis]|uniref:hypothetical protein n=1 Tax=Parablautia intestinalis TaxID=2320100 RepID=UPI002412A4E4|nr:hypothetical protein [Parablautia intestinalis]